MLVQSFDADQVQTFLDRLEVITRQLMRRQLQKRHVIVDLSAIDPRSTMIQWRMPAGMEKGAAGHELRCRPYLSDPEVIYQSSAVAEAERLRDSNLKSATNMVAQALDQCRAYTGDVQLDLTLGQVWCVVKNPNVMASGIEQQMHPLKPGQWNLFGKLLFDPRYVCGVC